MSHVTDVSGIERKVCDGCGREDGGPNSPLDIQPYAVANTNGVGTSKMDYCTHCGKNRNANIEVLTFAREDVQVVPVSDESKAAD